ncbi:Uncharacterised protein [Helicobacter fennelliae]|uniref:Uncharacterized protein n=2 Tax=Helicobacter fennelliae TaxID=215 RepID=T1DV09_9HELI|nr:hypothetical protein [Helicobacter fennelliae]GAD18127.1 hypothetical protein HFN_1725 [Helicobacter fennelliae MRY12-0050]SQB98068.1 Uncharacterised protein [Helicobacter fennelliae]STP06722.1 Uncharacterised protein [Helicobacter fennelliae]
MKKIKVFSSRFLESMEGYSKTQGKWEWQPANNDIYEIYASGAPTGTNSSTYAAETDNRSDSDRPNEGLLAI